jgi:hypothetical protein
VVAVRIARAVASWRVHGTADREHRLLLACAGARVDSHAISTIATVIGDGIDWTRAIALALHHGVAPALHTAFAASALVGAVPPEILDALAYYCRTTRERNTRLASELATILSSLAVEDISALPFKGVALAQTVYGDLAHRPVGDLDILVRPRDMTRVCALLVERGYRDTAGPALRTPVQHAMYRRYQCEYQFVHDANGFVVEPHWALVQQVHAIDLDYEGQFARAQRTTLAGSPVLVHSPEDLLLVLCVHGAKHEWERLGWIRDVAMLLERGADLGLDLDAALALARQQYCARMLFVGVELAHRLLNAPLPESLQRASRRDAAVSPLVDRVRHRLSAAGLARDNNTRVTRFSFDMHERVRNKLQYVSRTLLLPRREHIEMIALPATLAWAYYPLRWAHDYVALPLWIVTRPLRRRPAVAPQTR